MRLDGPEVELFIVGSRAFYAIAKERREWRTQALLRLKAPIYHGDDVSEMLDNKQCKWLIMALGVGISLDGDVPLGRPCYNRLFIVTDDTSHGVAIRGQIISFLHAYMRPILDYGMVFVPQLALRADLSPAEFDELVMQPSTRRHEQVPGMASLEVTLASLP